MIQTTLSSLLDEKGRDIFAIQPGSSVFDAIALMSEKGIGAVLVMDGARLLGIVSERDYTRKVILQGRSSRETTVDNIMSSPVTTAAPETSVEDAMRLMTERRIRHLPVIKDGALCGVISLGDLVKSVITAQKETIAHLHHYIGGGYMA